MEQTETSEHSPHPIILIAVAKRIFCINGDEVQWPVQ
jgi:hypothetical protein